MICKFFRIQTALALVFASFFSSLLFYFTLPSNSLDCLYTLFLPLGLDCISFGRLTSRSLLNGVVFFTIGSITLRLLDAELLEEEFELSFVGWLGL